MNSKIFRIILGRLLIAYGVVMLAPAGMAFYYQEVTASSFTIVGLLTIVFGLFLHFAGGTEGRMGVRESLTIVATSWIVTVILGSLPLFISGVVPDYMDALFEITSGLTATGATALTALEGLPRSILFWRSMTHWLGGMGIIVLFIVLLPNIGIGAVHLFKAEVPGPTNEKVMPRIRDTALTLWGIYVGLTILEIILLMIAGMTPFDAVNHAFSNMATGGFSTKDTNIGYFNSFTIELIMVTFMIISGVNFTIYINYWRKGSINVLRNTELKVYLFMILSSILVVAGALVFQGEYEWNLALRHAMFEVTTIITTTGFFITDYDTWPSLSKMLLFFLMFSGGCAASTTGGLKVGRLVLLVKMGWANIKQAIHPRLVINIEVQDKAIEPFILQRVVRFFFLYIFIFVFGSILLAATGLEPFEAMGATIACLGNVGPAFGIAGPLSTYQDISSFGKFILSWLMLLGRLELYTILILFIPEFWRTKRNW